MSQNTLSNESSVQLFKKYVFSPFQNRTLTSNQDQLQHITHQIYNWARSNGAQYISFFAYPMRYQTMKKYASFLSIKLIKENLLQAIGSEKLNFSQIWKEQFDGSSVPNGGLRQNHQSRSSLIWDHLSELFIRKRNKVLYFPSFIVTPQGHPLDDRLHFRKTEKMFVDQMKKLLGKFKIDHQDIFLTVSLQQQFFIVPKEFAEKRLDLKYTNRLLAGKNNFKYLLIELHTKQFLHKYKKPLKLGVPIEVRHCEGALNIKCKCVNRSQHSNNEDTTRKLLKNGLWAIFHEKPFGGVIGSGKHINWSIRYLDQKQKMINLYDLKSQHQQLLILMILVTLKAIQDNHKLFIASTMTAGNQIRLGEKEAPLPAMSVYLGEHASHLIEGLQIPQSINLKDKFDFLLKDQRNQVGDRNRTSTIAYSQNRFEYQLPGSSQNCTFPIIVIMASIMNEVKNLLRKIDDGQTISHIITEYKESTRTVRYEGNCYSEEWKKEAEKRELYNPKKTIVEGIKNITSQRKLLVESGIYTNKEIEARQRVFGKDYIETVQIERECLLKIINTNIIPRAFSFISTFPRQLHLKSIENRMKKFDKLLEELIGRTDELQKIQIDQEKFSNAYKIRQQIFKIQDLLDNILGMLPECDSLPDINRYLNKWETS